MAAGRRWQGRQGGAWASLSEDLLQLLLKELKEQGEQEARRAFGRVCTAWRRAALAAPCTGRLCLAPAQLCDCPFRDKKYKHYNGWGPCPASRQTLDETLPAMIASFLAGAGGRRLTGLWLQLPDCPALQGLVEGLPSSIQHLHVSDRCQGLSRLYPRLTGLRSLSLVNGRLDASFGLEPSLGVHHVAQQASKLVRLRLHPNPPFLGWREGRCLAGVTCLDIEQPCWGHLLAGTPRLLCLTVRAYREESDAVAVSSAALPTSLTSLVLLGSVTVLKGPEVVELPRLQQLVCLSTVFSDPTRHTDRSWGEVLACTGLTRLAVRPYWRLEGLHALTALRHLTIDGHASLHGGLLHTVVACLQRLPALQVLVLQLRSLYTNLLKWGAPDALVAALPALRLLAVGRVNGWGEHYWEIGQNKAAQLRRLRSLLAEQGAELLLLRAVHEPEQAFRFDCEAARLTARGAVYTCGVPEVQGERLLDEASVQVVDLE